MDFVRRRNLSQHVYPGSFAGHSIPAGPSWLKRRRASSREACRSRCERRWSAGYSREQARRQVRNEALRTHEAIMEDRDSKGCGDFLQSVARPPFEVL